MKLLDFLKEKFHIKNDRQLAIMLGCQQPTRGSQIIDGYGDDNSLDRLQSWDDYLPTDASKEVDSEFIADVWRPYLS